MPVAAVHRARDACIELVWRKREAGSCAQAEGVEIPAGRLDHAISLIAGTLGEHPDRAADRVPAIEAYSAASSCSLSSRVVMRIIGKVASNPASAKEPSGRKLMATRRSAGALAIR
jgi:hypothetical protein